MAAGQATGRLTLGVIGETPDVLQHYVTRVLGIFEAHRACIEKELKDSFSSNLMINIKARVGEPFTLFLELNRQTDRVIQRTAIVTVVNFDVIGTRIHAIIHRLFAHTFQPAQGCYCCDGVMHESIV